MGEAPWRVLVSGAPGLDNLRTTTLVDRETLQERIGFTLEGPVVLVTFHPETAIGGVQSQHDRRAEETMRQICELLAVLEAVDGTIVFTAPNADLNRHVILDCIRHFVAGRASARLVDTLGTEGYFSLMRIAAVMVGNSSSGIIEAPSFCLPVVNIGDRQTGRVRAPNVIDVADRRDAIADGIRRALDPEFRASLAGLVNPYGDGHAAERIAAKLADTPLDHTLMAKRFHDLPA
jgi:UDP-hydrolysing UDP-N-acetyl-D-glucosamine 2-epimerase